MPITLPIESPFQHKLNATIANLTWQANQQDAPSQQAINNALHYAIEKRMAARQYYGENKAYLFGLLSDISLAHDDYEKNCFNHVKALDTFEQLKLTILTLIRHETHSNKLKNVAN